MERQLSPNFLKSLKSGFLAVITKKVTADIDLDLQIRENYINLYFKGNSLLRLSKGNDNRYKVYIDPKFIRDLNIRDIDDESSAIRFVSHIPALKENILKYGKMSLEIEYEQMIIRANNLEPKNNSEYFIVDRQYHISDGRRFDLMGFFWDRRRRKRNEQVPLSLIEVKFALNPDIKDVDKQLNGYYHFIKDNSKEIAEEAETVFKQKLELGLYQQAENRIEVMKTLKFSDDVQKYHFILFLVDYNPNSTHFDLGKLKKLPFSHQIRVFRGGFAMWEQNTKSIL